MPIIIFLGLFFLWFLSGIRVIMEYQRGVVFRFGRLVKTKQAGLRWIIPFIDRLKKVDLRIIAMDVPSQDVITHDNVSLKVNAVIYFRVFEPENAIVQVEDFLFATSQLAQTTLRSVLGQHELDQLLAEREKINKTLQEILDRQTDNWGIKVTSVEVKHVDLPEEMKRSMAKQAEAERERRAKVIHAEGEFQASKRLGDASDIIRQHPPALHLRYLQALTDVAAENNSTTLFPIPMDFMSALMKKDK